MTDEDYANQILQFISSYREEYGYPPSYREIAIELGVGSINTVSRHLQSLKEKGQVDWKPGHPRTLQVVE